MTAKDSFKKDKYSFFFSQKKQSFGAIAGSFLLLEREFPGAFCDDRSHRVLGLRRLVAPCFLMTLKRKRTSSDVQC